MTRAQSAAARHRRRENEMTKRIMQVRGSPASQTELVVERLQSLAPLGAETVQLLRRMESCRTCAAGTDLIDEQDSAPRPRFITAGWAARVRWLADGRRQIVSFVTPGDAIGLGPFPTPIANCATVALTAVQTVDASEVAAALRSGSPGWTGLKEAVEIAAAIDQCTVLNQVVRLGRQTAFERMCHLLLELRDRMERAGLAAGHRFQMPLTQEVLADATGLSTVHVNRILQQLRREKLIDFRSGYMWLMKPEEMASIADHKPIVPNAWR
jgi:CRP-like cAMP-binding protein